MVFSSTIFLFAFLPLFLALYYLTPNQYRSVPILIGSYLFYAWWRVDFVLLFAGVTLWNYFIYKQMTARAMPRRWLQLGVIGNILTLGFFKYFNFGVQSFNDALQSLGGQPVALAYIILPIGISFFIFQAISFLIDVYRKDAPYPNNLIEFAAYLSLFPQLIAGPILKYKEMALQFRERTHNADKFSEGAYRFMIGFAQKVLIADSLAPLVDQTFGIADPTFIEAWLGAFAFTAQLYFDFMGYSSMTIGLGLMMGFRFIENFNHPYISRSITEFWRRWHISLSSWLRDYVYIPLGGNRKGRRRTYINLILTMLAGGIWHGANWTFALWGLWHGLFLAIERFFGVKNSKFMIIPTMFIVIIGWVLFQSPTIAHAVGYYQGMIGLNGMMMSDQLKWQITYQSLFVLAISWILIYLHPKFLEFREKEEGRSFMHTSGHKKPWVAGASIMLFLLAVTKLSADSYSPFLYFQF